MDPGTLVGALAVFTIGAVLLLAVAHFRSHLRDPENAMHARNIIAGGEGASSIAARSDPAVSDAPLKTRLDQSIASAHPQNPAHGRTRGERTDDLHVKKFG